LTNDAGETEKDVYVNFLGNNFVLKPWIYFITYLSSS
jgi:hypothetical protein